MSTADLLKIMRADLLKARREAEVHRRHVLALQSLYAGIDVALDCIDGGVVEGSPCSTPAERIMRICEHAMGTDQAVRRYVASAVDQARDMGVTMQPGIALIAQVHGREVVVAMPAVEIIAADLAGSLHRLAMLQLSTLVDGMVACAVDHIEKEAADV